jgi:murein DD-endopeptidase MepM/ murein hydrolase activator NlpD
MTAVTSPTGPRHARKAELMSIVIRRLAFILALLALVTATAPGSVRQPARADDPNVNDAIAQQARMEAELSRQRSQLDQLRRQQADLTTSLSDLDAQLGSVGLKLDEALQKLDLVTRNLDRSRADLERYRLQIKNFEADIDQLAIDIRQTGQDLSARESLLEEHLKAAYEQSQTSILEILLSTDSFSKASNQLTSMLTLSEEDRQLAEEIRGVRDRLQIRRQMLRDGRASLADLRDAEAERAVDLARQQEQVDAARKELEEYQKQLEELQAEQQLELAAAESKALETADVIAEQQRDLEAQQALVDQLKEQADELDIAYRGRFDWPERGKFFVTQEYGHTSFSSYHTGIDMAYRTPHCGGPIYAAADGVVLADGRPNLKYGDTAIGVVIGHSQRLQTWYWHMSREVVSVGDEVVTGQIIGYEGATGIATGCHLHFQVMFDGSPASPRSYLP